MEAINLDLLPGAMPPIVHVSQGDVGRQFKIAIYDDTGAAYSLTGKTLSIVGHKGDGNVFQYAIPSSAISGNEVTITTEKQMTPAAGKALCEIRIEQNGTKLGTCNFVMDVEQGPADMGSLSISALYLIDALFQEATADVEASAASAAAAANSATAAANSATAAAGSATTATTKAGNAADSATAAANSATAAYNSANDAENAKSSCVIARNDCRAAEERANHYADAATNSATAAANSATAASGYADAADTSADNAADYATAASGSATAAATSANNASASETAAETAETNAAASATAAAGSASNAATSESNASTSETNAANSATAASGSATNAANSATAAANSATAAAASESKITNMTVSSQSVPYTQSAEVTKTEVGGVYNLDFKIPRGEPTSGHDVEANPSGVATGDLTKLGIDGTIYNIASGGGGANILPTFLNASSVKSGATFSSVVEWLTGGSGQADSEFIWIYYYNNTNANKFPFLRTQPGQPEQPAKELDIDFDSLQVIIPQSSITEKIHAVTSRIPCNILYEVYNKYSTYPNIQSIEYYGSNAILYYDSSYNMYPAIAVYGKTTSSGIADADLELLIWSVQAVKAAEGCWKEV